MMYHRLAFGEGPHPADANTVVVFVNGGISPAEIYQVKALLSTRRSARSSQNLQNKAMSIVLISSDLISPTDTLFQMFKSLPPYLP